MKSKTLKDVLDENPEYKPGWVWNPKSKTLDNPRFGSVEQIVVCNDDNKPIWDQYQIKEGSGAIVVPYYSKEGKTYIGFILAERPVVAEGINSLELPRGFSNISEDSKETVKRELLEETGRKAIITEYIGLINANTAFYATNIPVYAVEVDLSKPEEIKTDGFEKILKAEFIETSEAIEKIKKDEIICGLTKAALLQFLAKKVFI